MAIFKVTIIGAYLGQQMVNTLHFQDRGAATGTLEDLAPRIDSWHSTIFRMLHSSMRTFSLIDVRGVGAADVLQYAMAPTNTTGGDANVGGNPAEAIVLSLKSVYASRRRNGRIYVGGFAQTMVNQGQVTSPAGTNNFNTAIGSTMALFGPNGSQPYVLGVYSDPGPDKLGQPRAPLFTPTAQIKLNLITGSQRRRRIGVGA